MNSCVRKLSATWGAASLFFLSLLTARLVLALPGGLNGIELLSLGFIAAAFGISAGVWCRIPCWAPKNGSVNPSATQAISSGYRSSESLDQKAARKDRPPD
jgi:hypothetical protein